MSLINKILNRKLSASIYAIRNTFNHQNCQLKSKNYSTVVDDKPPKYTTSKAAKWKASESFTGPERDTPWYQQHIVTLSTIAFLVYFCILREENDIDEKLSRPLHETIPISERPYLIATINNLKQQGKDYSQYEKRLRDLETH